MYHLQMNMDWFSNQYFVTDQNKHGSNVRGRLGAYTT